MSLGLTPGRALFRSTAGFCDSRVGSGSIYGVLHRECHGLFPDAMFADLFTEVGRRSVPPMIVAVVMVLQRIEGCSDREAVDRFCFDARWKYAAGGLDFDHPGFVHTVLVDMRARLAASSAPTPSPAPVGSGRRSVATRTATASPASGRSARTARSASSAPPPPHNPSNDRHFRTSRPVSDHKIRPLLR